MGKEGEQTTLDLDQVMKDGLAKYGGELVEAAADESATTPADKEETASADAKAKAGKKPEESSPAPGETEGKRLKEEKEKETEDPEKEAQREEEEKKAKEAEAKADKEAKEPRFKTHEESEEGYRNLQGEKTKVEQENAALRKRITDLETAEKRKAELEKAETEAEDFATDCYEKALLAIDELDADADDYQKQVAKIFAKRDGDIRRFEREQGVSTTPDETTSPAESRQPDGGQETFEVSEDDDAETQAKKVVVYRDNKAKEAGIEPEDEHFLLVCRSTPNVDAEGKELTIPEQVQWAIDETIKYHSSQEKNFRTSLKTEITDKNKKQQEEDLALGRSTTTTPAEKKDEDESKPVSLDDALEKVREERVL